MNTKTTMSTMGMTPPVPLPTAKFERKALFIAWSLEAAEKRLEGFLNGGWEIERTIRPNARTSTVLFILKKRV